MILMTMYIGDTLYFWALTLSTAYGVLAFVGYLGMTYANPNVDEPIIASEPAPESDERSAALIPFLPRRANKPVQSHVDLAA